MEEFKNKNKNKHKKKNPPPLPQINASNFANNTTYNPNTNLYDHIFSGLYHMPNIQRAENSSFNNMPAYKTTTTIGEANCKNNCNNDTHCTSYKYNTVNNKNNCVLYNTFPSKIISNKPNTNVGYKTNYSMNFNKLNGNAKTRIQKEVANKYINNYFNTNLNYTSCLSINNNDSKTNINLEPQCVYSMYKNIGRGSEKFIPKYTNKSDIDKSSDSNSRLDKYYKLRTDQTNAKSNIVALNSKNNGLSESQIRLNNRQKANLKKLAEAINNRQNIFYDDISSNIGSSNKIETYNNYDSDSKMKLLLLMLIILSILFIFFIFFKNNKI